LDTNLVQRAVDGDAEAFSAVLRSQVDHMYAVAFRIVRDTTLAEDATQQAMLDMWTHLRSIRTADRYEAWSYRILVRACYREIKRRRRWNERLRALPDPVSSVDDEADALAERDRLRRCFAKIPADQRAVIVLHHYADLPVSRIAESLEIPVGTVRSRLFYGMRAMRAAVDADERMARRRGSA
jgi:RNA polymerase sigma-70 factor, ECF subfamily